MCLPSCCCPCRAGIHMYIIGQTRVSWLLMAVINRVNRLPSIAVQGSPGREARKVLVLCVRSRSEAEAPGQPLSLAGIHVRVDIARCYSSQRHTSQPYCSLLTNSP